jgi:ubiquinone/menaquinone biosynthesis C-methylase UbiE
MSGWPVCGKTADDNLWNEALEWTTVRALRADKPDPTAAAALGAGCAAGAVSEWLLSRGCDVVGIDICPALVVAARQRCNTSISDPAQFLVADPKERMPVEDATFGGALCSLFCSLALHELNDITSHLAVPDRRPLPGGR